MGSFAIVSVHQRDIRFQRGEDRRKLGWLQGAFNQDRDRSRLSNRQERGNHPGPLGRGSRL